MTGRGRRGKSVQPEWMRALRVGDVLQRGTHGLYRVVREVNHRRCGNLLCVVFTKQRPSWTGRPDTVYFAADLKTLGFRPVGARLRLTSSLDRAFAAFLDSNEHRLNRPYRDRYTVTEADVRGVA